MSTVESLFTRLKTAISKLEEDWNAPIDAETLRAFEESELFLAPRLKDAPDLLQEAISLLSRALLNLRQDPRPVTRLLARVIEPLSFSDVLLLDPPVDFVGGLDLAAQHFHLLVLDVLSKATRNSRDAATLAGMPTVIYSLVKLWLCSANLEVADKSESVLLGLLEVDMEASDVPLHGVGDEIVITAGQGLLWRRMFGDKDVYGLFYSLPSLRSNSDQIIGKSQKSIAQARLMSLVLQIGRLDWNYIVRSHHPEIEASYGLKSNEGLLHFVALYVVDYKTDVLIHMNLIQFFSDLLMTITKPAFTNKNTSKSLQFLQEHGIHERSMSFWMTAEDPSHDPVDLNFLYGSSANYVATFAKTCPGAFLAGDDARRVLIRLMKALDVSANQWAHGQSPKHDLNVLSSVPHVALLPQRQLGTGRQSSPLLLIPCKVTNEDALSALSKIFACPNSHEEPQRDPSGTSITPKPDPQAQATRALLHVYLQYHESFYADLINHASTVALPEKALAAINVLTTIVAAQYPPLPETSRYNETGFPTHIDDLPSEMQLRSHAFPFTTSLYYFDDGLSAITQTPARDKVIPWLLRPAQSFSHLVGGRGDAESAAFRIAAAKWDLLGLVHEKLRSSPDAGLEALRQAVAARLAEGTFGSGQEVGGRVATLEM